LPKFKNRSNFTSFTFVMEVKIQGSKIYLLKLGWMRFYNSRPIPDGFTIKACAVRKRQNGWYVVKIDDKPGIFLKNGQSKNQGLNRSIYDGCWVN
jgi:putative transposase